ncbi:UBX domain-containing protein 11 [Gouania willdenowi]|uniref:UBX domain-containing protein 11 n=1 Tax=Gouania willdenowi TaxID=441366 RepID=UPI0010545016|nr:UBX domain-containing protein 11 [Gouania willdenowi]
MMSKCLWTKQCFFRTPSDGHKRSSPFSAKRRFHCCHGQQSPNKQRANFRLPDLLYSVINMSSPLSMLKKTRRSPLQGQLKKQRDGLTGPFRRSMRQELRTEQVQGDSSETNPLPPSSNTSLIDAFTRKPKASNDTDAPPSDSELMSVMMRRLSQLEKTAESQAQEIERKDKTIADLQDRLKTLTEGAQGQRDRNDLEDLDLEEKCHQLQKQVHEMEAFLSDYGLIWVGDKDDSADCDTAGTSANQLYHMDFDLVLQRISDLNILAGKGEYFVQTTATGARLAEKDPIKLSLYSNGIIMLDGPFRSYEEPSTQWCLQDLMDGFFPAELKDRFPDGVPFQVEDRRHEKFTPKLDTFPGEGRAVCGHRSGDGSHLAGTMPTTGQSLNSLPRVVVEDGGPVDISSSGLCDSHSSSSVIHIITPALQAAKTESFIDETGPLPSPPNVVTLKVRSEDGNETYLLKMFTSETLGQLRQYLDKHRGEDHAGCDIIRAHPQQYFNSNNETLQSCGLTTNTTLLLQKRKHNQSQTN